MTQEVTTTEENKGIALSQGAWGAEETDNADILIPKLLLMQGLSDFVSSGDAAAGDIVNSVSGAKLGDKEVPVEVIPISTFKTWKNSELVGQKYEFRSIEPMTPENSSADLEYEKDGTTWRRDRGLNFYVLLKSEAGDADAMPYLISFYRTSYKAGKALATHFAKCKMAMVPPASKTVNLTCSLQKNDLGQFWVFDVKPGEKTAPEALEKAYHWYKVLQAGTHKVDDSDEVDTTDASVSGESKF